MYVNLECYRPKTNLLPQRVKKLNLPFTELSVREEDEDGENDFPNITPLDGKSYSGMGLYNANIAIVLQNLTVCQYCNEFDLIDG